MGRIFDLDSPVMDVLNKVMNTVILNVCFMISCLPVITIGAAISALYSVNLKMVRQEESYVFSSYWKAFKAGFKQSTVCWLVLAAAGSVLIVDFGVIKNLSGSLQKILAITTIVLFLIYIVVVTYVFPYIARFHDNFLTCLKNAFMIGWVNPGYTAAIILITAACVILTFFSVELMLRAIFIWLVGGFSLLSYVNSFFLRKVFEKY